MYSINIRPIEAFVTGSAQPKPNQEMLNKIPVQIPDKNLLEKFIQAIRANEMINKISRQCPAETLFLSVSQKAFSDSL